MADEQDAPKAPAPGDEAGQKKDAATPAPPPPHAPGPPVPTPPMTAATPEAPPQAAPAPRSNAVAPAATAGPPATPVPAGPAPDPAQAAAKAPAAVHTKGPDAPAPGTPNPGAQDAAAAQSPTAAAVRASDAKPSPAAALDPTPGSTAPPPARPAPATAVPATKPAAAAPAKESAISRRGFMKWSLPVGWVAFSAACASSLVATARFLFPNVLFEPPQSFKAGFPGEYNVGEVDTRWKDAFGVWIVREAEGFYALIAVCTHLGCSPNWLPTENKFKCPCHGSGFYRTGVNFEGPAPRPLERARVVLADDGQILVDKSVKFQQEKGEWENPDSFLKA
jgi:cytochrome b6-f complex iron-sulfur subunit